MCVFVTNMYVIKALETNFIKKEEKKRKVHFFVWEPLVSKEHNFHQRKEMVGEVSPWNNSSLY